MKRILVIFVALVIACGAAAQDRIATREASVVVTKIVSGLDQPWAIGFLPGGSWLLSCQGPAKSAQMACTCNQVNSRPSCCADW